MTDLNASTIAEYEPVEAGIAELRNKYAGVIWQIASTKDFEAAKQARSEVREPRYQIEKLRKELKAPAIAYGKRIDDEAKRITAALLEIEAPIDAAIKAEEERKERERQAREAAELRRVQNIQAEIQRIRDLPSQFANSAASDIDRAWNGLQDTVIDPAVFEEFIEQATVAKTETLDRLHAQYNQAVSREEEHARVMAERARLDRERAELEAQRKAHAERLAAEEAELKARREAEQALLRKQQEEIAKAQAEIDRQKREQAEAERQRLEAARLMQEGIERAKAEAAIPQTQPAGPGSIQPQPAKPTRPSDEQIIEVLALHFRVHESAVIAWLLEVDLDAASQRLVAEFS